MVVLLGCGRVARERQPRWLWAEKVKGRFATALGKQPGGGSGSEPQPTDPALIPAEVVCQLVSQRSGHLFRK